MQILILVIFLATMLQVPYQFSRDNVEAKVVKTERVCDRDSDCKYLIFTDKEVFENTDSLINMKFNSSDFYSKIEVGKEYNFYVVGWRVPFLSMYKNVLEYKEIK